MSLFIFEILDQLVEENYWKSYYENILDKIKKAYLKNDLRNKIY